MSYSTGELVQVGSWFFQGKFCFQIA